jgi:hypothetical protein
MVERPAAPVEHNRGWRNDRYAMLARDRVPLLACPAVCPCDGQPPLEKALLDKPAVAQAVDFIPTCSKLALH